MGYGGANRTCRYLNHYYPGHDISIRVIATFVKPFPICQKDRQRLNDQLAPAVRHIEPSHRRSVSGMDILGATPADDLGNKNLIVVANHFTKLCGVYPSPTKDARAASVTLFQHFC
jgi:hypothetical protein